MPNVPVEMGEGGQDPTNPYICRYAICCSCCVFPFVYFAIRAAKVGTKMMMATMTMMELC